MNLRRWTAGLVILLIVGTLTPAQAAPLEKACLPDPVGIALEATGLAPFTEDPEAGWWTTWNVSVLDFEVDPPPASLSTETLGELIELNIDAQRRTPQQVASIARWDEGGAARPWTKVLLDTIRANSTRPDKNPPRISRDIALVETAIFDALAVTWKAKLCYRRPAPFALDPTIAVAGQRHAAPSYPSEHATVAGVMKVMLPALYGVNANVMVAEAVNSRLWAGANYRSDLSEGLQIGQAVANAVLAGRAGDGSSATWDGSGRITGTCNWEPTPPGFNYPPLEPMWGHVSPWLMETGDEFRPAPPPACDSQEYIAAVRDVYEMSLQMTDRQREVAFYWAGGPGTETPPGMNLRTAMDATLEHGLSTMHEARVLAHVGTALADAAIAAWDAKFAYWWDRPVTAIRRLWDPTWSSLIGTPPFPGYISGHSTFSSAAMRTLGGFFPEDAVAFDSMASQAALSRFYGGIHVRYDNEVGLDVGRRIGDRALERAAADGAS